MTDKEKDAVWRSLPENIKEEIATDYSKALQAYSFDPNNARIDAHIKFLEEYFGTHNLTAEKEVKPKFKVGDRIVFCGRTAKITEVYPDNPDRVFVVFDDNGLGGVFGVEYIEPYAEQEPKTEPKHGEIVIPVKAEFDESIWLPYRMELAKEIAVALIAKGHNIAFVDESATLIAKGIVERLKGEK